MEATNVVTTEPDPRIDAYRRLRSMGMPSPPDAPVDLWNLAGPYTCDGALASMRGQLSERVVAGAQGELPKDEKQMLKHFFPQAVAVRVDIMNDPTAKHSDRLAASDTFVEHTVGKAPQTIEHTGSLAIEVHNQLEKLCRDIRSGTILDTDNLLAKPRTPVDNFLEKHMPEKFIVGRKVAPVVEQKSESQPAKGLPEGTSSKA